MDGYPVKQREWGTEVYIGALIFTAIYITVQAVLALAVDGDVPDARDVALVGLAIHVVFLIRAAERRGTR